MTVKWVPNLYGFTCDVGPFQYAATLLKQTYLHGGTPDNPTYKVVIFEKVRMARETRNREVFRQYYTLEEAKRIAIQEVILALNHARDQLKFSGIDPSNLSDK